MNIKKFVHVKINKDLYYLLSMIIKKILSCNLFAIGLSRRIYYLLQISKNWKIHTRQYRYMYLKEAWHLKTYIDTNNSIDFEKLHLKKNQWLFGVNKTSVFLKNKSNFNWPIFSRN